MANVLKKLIHEPLVHFVLLGAVIFIGYSFLARPVNDSGTIHITKDEIASLRDGFFSTWHRPPTEAEWDGLIRDRVKQEVYCREAVSLGLDKNDIIIQRRLQQKLEFIVNDNIEDINPGDSVLKDFLAKHPDKFAVEPRYTFRQVFLAPEKHGRQIERDASEILKLLNQSDKDFQKSSDPSLLNPSLSNARSSEVSGEFGVEFTNQLKKLPTGNWQGPVRSTYGLHLVQIIDRKVVGAPALSDLGEAVNREWGDSRRKEANEKFYQELLKNYKVTIEDNQH